MLVEQQQDLRKFHDAWSMSVYEIVVEVSGKMERSGQWEVVLSRSQPGLAAYGRHSNAKYAFEDALAMAKVLQDRYGEPSKNNS